MRKRRVGSAGEDLLELDGVLLEMADHEPSRIQVAGTSLPLVDVEAASTPAPR